MCNSLIADGTLNVADVHYTPTILKISDKTNANADAIAQNHQRSEDSLAMKRNLIYEGALTTAQTNGLQDALDVHTTSINTALSKLKEHSTSIDNAF